MPIAISCPKCNKKHKAPDSLAGKSARCGCGTVIQIPAAAAAAAKPVAALVASGPSIFDEVTAADIEKLKKPTTAPAAASDAAPAAVPNAAADYMARAAEKRPSVVEMPSSVKMAMWGLGIPGVFSLIALIVCVSLFLGGSAGGFGKLLPILIVIQMILTGLNLGAFIMLHTRTPGARVVGFIAAGLNLLGSPVNIVCGIVAAIGLFNYDTGAYLSAREET